MPKYNHHTMFIFLLVLLTVEVVLSSHRDSVVLSASEFHPSKLTHVPTRKHRVVGEIPSRDLNVRGGNKESDKTQKNEAATSTEGSTSMTASVFNLVNNVAGAGILALSAAQAAGTGWIPSIAICSALGAISARTFVMVGESCDMLNERDFKVTWTASRSIDSVHDKFSYFYSVVHVRVYG